MKFNVKTALPSNRRAATRTLRRTLRSAPIHCSRRTTGRFAPTDGIQSPFSVCESIHPPAPLRSARRTRCKAILSFPMVAEGCHVAGSHGPPQRGATATTGYATGIAGGRATITATFRTYSLCPASLLRPLARDGVELTLPRDRPLRVQCRGWIRWKDAMEAAIEATARDSSPTSRYANRSGRVISFSGTLDELAEHSQLGAEHHPAHQSNGQPDCG